MPSQRARSFVRALVVGATLAGCSPGVPDKAPVRPVPTAPAASPTRDASSPAAMSVDAGSILAWTDEAAITELTRSCAFAPPVHVGLPEERSEKSPLACDLHFEQACVADPCFHEDEESCKHGCVTTCNDCGASCVSSCDACKTVCTDDACRRTCAQSCGRCRQACLTTRDQCSTAHCTEVYTQCRTKLVSSWLAHDCDAVCATCTKKCGPNDMCDCWEKGPGAAVCRANPMLCPEMHMAPERRQLDPKWKANRCEDVCAKIWSCAKAACDKSGCVEPVKMFDRCSSRTAGAAACGVIGLAGLTRCPEDAGQ